MEVFKLPDGSAVSVVSMPLPKDHWIYAEGPNVPPMPFKMGVGAERSLLQSKVREAAKYAIRCVTSNGTKEDSDPDALIQQLIVGIFGYHTTDGDLNSPFKREAGA